MSIIKSLLTTKEYLEVSKRLIIGLLTLGISIIMISSCVKMYTTAEHGIQMNETVINEIVIGKTTRSELFKLLGTPHSIFQGQAEFTEGYSIHSINEYYSHEQNRYLSSIDEGHYAFLYRFGKTSSKSTAVFVVLISSRNTHIKIRSDELLILIDKKTNIVDDVAYRKDTSGS